MQKNISFHFSSHSPSTKINKINSVCVGGGGEGGEEVGGILSSSIFSRFLKNGEMGRVKLIVESIHLESSSKSFCVSLFKLSVF